MSFVTSALLILSVVYLALGLIYLRFWIDKRRRLAYLTETLEQLEMAAAAGNVGMWTRSVDGEILWASEKAGEIWGFSNGERFTQADLVELLHPDDHERVMSCVQALTSGKEEYQIEFRIVAKGGTLRWVQSQGRIEKVNGTPVVRGALVDITKQKMAETAVRQLSHKLITAQETERARVALELHDDLNQNIALLSIQLGMLQKQPKDLDFVTGQLGQFMSDVERLSKDVHRISYELHPAKLTQLGLEAAVRGFCREFAEKHEVVVDFVAENIRSDASMDIELCLYRITQESLQNVIKHSKAQTVSVTINCDDEEIVLTIVDDGKGFDINSVKPNGGLGLISIDERAKHVDGTAVIRSMPGKGTTVEVRIPVDQQPSLISDMPVLIGQNSFNA
jgi:PAS domain S-box-containing protein